MTEFLRARIQANKMAAVRLLSRDDCSLCCFISTTNNNYDAEFYLGEAETLDLVAMISTHTAEIQIKLEEIEAEGHHLMEMLILSFDPDRYDAVVKGSLPENGDLEIVIKPRATVNGYPMVAVTFTVQLPDGSLRRAQAVTTLRAFEGVFSCIRGARAAGRLMEPTRPRPEDN